MMRHARQIPVFGEDGQRMISETTVGIVGLGGLGCNVITQLACAGVGRFIIADDQTSEESNMNRQFVHSPHSVGIRKTDSSGEWIRRISDASVTEHAEKVTDRNASNILDGCDIVVDCTDSDLSRLALNRFALKYGKPLIYGGVESMFGQVSTVIPGITPCLGCILSARDTKDCPSVGAAVSLIASVQSAEVLKLITGTGDLLTGKMFIADIMNNSYRIIDLGPKGCPVCNHF